MSTSSSRQIFVAEPPAQYLVRPPVVSDCSVLSALLFAEAERDEAASRLAGRTLHAPTLLDHEIASMALKKAQRGCEPEMIRDALAAYQAQPLTLHRTDLAGQCALAERFGLSAYDAAYLWLAGELKVPLATFDRKLGMAARDYLGSLGG